MLAIFFADYILSPIVYHKTDFASISAPKFAQKQLKRGFTLSSKHPALNAILRAVFAIAIALTNENILYLKVACFLIWQI